MSKREKRDVIWLAIDKEGHAELIRWKDDADRARMFLSDVRIVEYREHRPKNKGAK